MRIVHLLRKPLAGSVVANVLEHGCGGVAIDASRVSLKGEDSPSIQRREAAARSGRAGRQTSGLCDEGRFESAKDPEVGLAYRPGEALGRWPSNLILEHTSECLCQGTKRVPTTTASAGAPGWRTDYVGGETKARGFTGGYAEEDGCEAVLDWECSTGCPVWGLDDQSGFARSDPNPRRNQDSQSVALGFIRSTLGAASPPDAGGASRFFKQIGGRP